MYCLKSATPTSKLSTSNSIQTPGTAILHLVALQDIFIVPTADLVSLSDRLAAASAVHRSLKDTARNAGQEVLQRGPRGGFCNGAGTFEHLMDCLMTSLDTAGHLGRVEFVVDVQASRLVPSSEESEVVEKDEERTTEYDLTTFSSGTTALELTSAQTLLETYLEWLEKYPITAFVEPFADTDVAMSKELLIRGNQVLQAKAGAGRDPVDSSAAAPTGETQAESPGPTENVEIGGDDSCLLRVIADKSVSKPSQLMFVNEQRGANAVVINTSKFSTLSEIITLTTRARDLGWAIMVAAVDEHELEGDFLAELGVGMRAEQILLGGLRSASTIAACTRLMRVEDEGVPHVGVGNE